MPEQTGDLNLSREAELVLDQSALLVVDMQNYVAHPHGALYSGAAASALADHPYFCNRLQLITGNIAALQKRCRATGIEVLYCVIESLTQDGRDRGLDYKITGFHVPRGSWDARVIDALAPQGDEIVFSKTSSSVFVSTNIDYVLRALGTRHLVMCGIATDQCVESAVRDACDLGYLVTLATDACGTYSQERQLASETAIRGYCRQRTTAALLAEINAIRKRSHDS